VDGDYKDDDLSSKWYSALEVAVKAAKQLNYMGVTKQLCNRLLEPFMWHTVIVTSTEWENFFALRCPKYTAGDELYFRSKKDYMNHYNFDGGHTGYSDMEWLLMNRGQAEIHMMALAEAMWDAKNESTPKELKVGEWHVPFGDDIDNEKIVSLMSDTETINSACIKIATARCARVSYTVVGEEGKEGKEPNYKNDIKLHDSLMVSKHASPFEHCALCTGDNIYSRNFTGGWKQYREIICL
jgi:uncharacterized C2H2 Zn-finger protein